MMEPRGTLIAIGGNEKKEYIKVDEKFHTDFGEGIILQDITRYAGDPQSRVEVIISASNIPDIVGQHYRETLHRLGIENSGILDIRDRQTAEDPNILRRIKEADVLLFSGGDQSRISRFIRNTKAHELIYDRFLYDDFIIAGTSAGAVVMAEDMVTGGRNSNILKRNDLKMGKGLGLIKHAIIDSHFIRRGRFGRLAEAVALHPDKLGIGLGEDTGVIIKEGNSCEIIGSGMVILFDGSNFTYNNARKLKNYVPISLANLTVHILSPKDKYYIREKKEEIHHDPRNYKPELENNL